MSQGPITRVLMVEERVGAGVHGDPVRRVQIFVDAETLQVICRYDDYAIEDLRKNYKP